MSKDNSPKDWSALFKDYEAGKLPSRVVAKKHGISHQRMYEVLENHGIKRRQASKKRKPIPDKAELVKLYKSERHLGRVAKALNTTIPMCRKLLKEAGIKPERRLVTDRDIKSWRIRIENGENINMISKGSEFSYNTIRYAIKGR